MTRSTKPEAGSFAARVREILRDRGMTIAQLAEQAELDPSLTSRLLAENASTRRDPRPEHVIAIARALEKAPSDLAVGTDAESALADWIPRAELTREIDARLAAQKEASDERTAAAIAREEARVYRAQVDQLSSEQARVADDLAKERMAHARTVRERDAQIAAVRGEVASLQAERDAERARAAQNYRAWSAANSALEGARRNAATATGVALFAGILGIGAVASAASGDDDEDEPPPPRRRRR